MTEEEIIIIDGVNVAGCCKCYNVEQKILCGASGICANNPNCYYKQLKRLEQENKELKGWKERVVKLFESACRCKYLNEETDICSYTNDKCMNINKCAYKYQNLSDTYRSVLEEIKGICQDENDTCTGECGNFNVAQRVLDVLCNLEG